MPSGDPELAAELGELAGRRPRSVAAAVIDLHAQLAVRTAYIGADAGTRFEIGSITKGLTGMLLADAVARREVSLATTVGELAPLARGTELASVTLTELCTHTSGLPRLPESAFARIRLLRRVVFGFDPYRGTADSEVVKVAAAQRLARRGTSRYSNLGAALLGQLVAITAGTGYAALLRDRILGPIGMHASAVARDDSSAPPGWSERGRRSRPWIMDGYAPAGAVVSTIGDIALLAESLLRGVAPGQDSLLPIAGVDTDRPGRATGMFWIIDPVPASDHTMIWHNGQTGGYSAFFALVPGRARAVAVLANVARASEQQRIALALL